MLIFLSLNHAHEHQLGLQKFKNYLNSSRPAVCCIFAVHCRDAMPKACLIAAQTKGKHALLTLNFKACNSCKATHCGHQFVSNYVQKILSGLATLQCVHCTVATHNNALQHLAAHNNTTHHITMHYDANLQHHTLQH